MDNYVDVSSFTHHPFYSRFIIEVPDNWMWAEVYNVPLEEMMQIVDNALENGYTVAWGTDVSEKGFSRTKGIGVIPEARPRRHERHGGRALGQAHRAGEGGCPLQVRQTGQGAYDYAGDAPDFVRQLGDDRRPRHADHGVAKDQNGTPYYKVQNSWNTVAPYDGFWYFSKPFVAYKTTSLMVNKNAIPKEIAKKLGLK